MKQGKRFDEASKLVDKNKLYDIKEESFTHPGVSSISNSTPVVFSKNEIFLHSLQINFHLNSSFGKSTVLVVNSSMFWVANFGRD